MDADAHDLEMSVVISWPCVSMHYILSAKHQTYPPGTLFKKFFPLTPVGQVVDSLS